MTNFKKLKEENQKLKEIFKELFLEKDKGKIIEKIEHIKNNHSFVNLIK